MTFLLFVNLNYTVNHCCNLLKNINLTAFYSKSICNVKPFTDFHHGKVT